MTALEVLNALKSIGASLRIDDAGRLIVNAPTGTITPGLRAAVTRNKADLLAMAALDACERAWDAGDVAGAELWAAEFSARAAALWASSAM